MSVNGIRSENYDEARQLASDIFRIATDLDTTFKGIDTNMDNLHNQSWMSSGSTGADNSYQALRGNYDAFYKLVTRMNQEINETQDTYEEVDASVKAAQTAVTDAAKKIQS